MDGLQTSSEPVITLGESFASELLDRVVPIQHPPTRWPAEPCPAPDEQVSLRAQARAFLRDDPGWLVIDTGLAHRTDDEVASAAWNLFTVLCEPVPQYRTGELVHIVEVSEGPAAAASTYSQSTRSGGFHTDGTLLEATPEVAMLAGINAADEGGETVVIDGDAIVARLLEDSPQHVPVLEQARPFHSGDGSDPVRTHRVVEQTAGRTSLRFNPLYVELGYANRGELVPPELEQAFAAVNVLADDPSLQIPTLITRGKVLLWNNFRCLHGRRPFSERQHRRRLLRAYGRRFPAAIPGAPEERSGRRQP